MTRNSVGKAVLALIIAAAAFLCAALFSRAPIGIRAAEAATGSGAETGTDEPSTVPAAETDGPSATPEAVTEVPSGTPEATPDEAATATPAGATAETPTASPAEPPTDPPTEPPTEPPTDPPTEPPTEPPTPTPEPMPEPLPEVAPHVDTVRIGLKFNKSAVDVLTTGSDSGGTMGIVRNNTEYSPVLRFYAGSTVTARADSGYHIAVTPPLADIAAARLEMLRISRLMEGAGTSLLYMFDGANWFVGAGFYQNYPAAGVKDVTGQDRWTLLSGRLSEAGYELSVLTCGSGAVKMYVDGSPVLILSVSDSQYKVRVTPLDPGEGTLPPLLKLGLARYRGYFDIHRHQGGKLVLVNDVDVEDYTYAVVPSEMIAGTPVSWEWRKEGLKAQAIMARTLAYYYIYNNKLTAYGFHMDDTTNYQVYSGYIKDNGDPGEFENTTRATRDTAGIILTYKDIICDALFYHGNNGGYTEVTETVWGGTQEPYVSVPDPWTPDYPWKKTYTGATLSTRVADYIYNHKGISIGSLRYINVTDRAVSGRVTEMIFEGSETDALLTLQQTRLCLNTVGQLFWFDVGETLRIDYQSDGRDDALSTRARKYLEGTAYTLAFLPDSYAVRAANGYTYERIRILGPSDPKQVVIRGNGHGHGVGMSQDGAEEMSRAGKSFEDIIQFYMPGVRLIDEAEYTRTKR
ncbi:MAG: SpoIID/LytB domain-containing protein [Clostridia bacterium]|nr:SpoIID/LytB domain-containing protein [Clostridia bacterium]